MENQNKQILSEGIVNRLLQNLFKGFRGLIGSTTENLLKKSVDEILTQTSKSGKGLAKITTRMITNNKSYQNAVVQAVEEAARVKHKMTFSELSKKLPQEADKLVTDVDDVMRKGMSDEITKRGSTISDDVAKSSKEVGDIQKQINKASTKNPQAAKNLQTDLKNATANWKQNTKMASRAAEAEKLVKSMPSTTRKQVDNILKNNAKIATTTGADLGGKIGTKTVTVKTPGGFWKATGTQITKLPGTIKRVVIRNAAVKGLIMLGVSVGAIYLIYQFLFPDDSIILQDENGNDLSDLDKLTDTQKCLAELVKNKEGIVETNPDGSLTILVKTTEYPDGLRFFLNNRVEDIKTKKKGTWNCKTTQALVSENTKNLIDLFEDIMNEVNPPTLNVNKDVNKMIDLLDFPVSGGNLKDAVKLLQQYVGKPEGKVFLDRYQKSGWGSGSLSKSVRNVFTTEPSSVEAKETLQKLIAQIEGGEGSTTTTTTEPTPGEKVGLKNIDIVWDKEGGDGGGDGTKKTTPPKSIYTNCNSKELPHQKGCKSEKIREIQKCLGLESKYHTGNYGPITEKALVDMGFDTTNGLTTDIYDKIISNCGDRPVERIRKTETGGLTKTKVGGVGSSDVNSPKINAPSDLNLAQSASMSGKDLYDSLKSQGLIIGLDGGRRIKYKGPDLDDTQLGKLDDVLSTNGYTRIKQLEDMKRYGSKYVWLKS